MSPTFHTTPAPWLSSVQCFWSHVTHPCDIRHMWGDAQLNQLQGWKTFCSYKIRLQLTFTPYSRTMAAGRNLIQRLKNYGAYRPKCVCLIIYWAFTKETRVLCLQKTVVEKLTDKLWWGLESDFWRHTCSSWHSEVCQEPLGSQIGRENKIFSFLRWRKNTNCLYREPKEGIKQKTKRVHHVKLTVMTLFIMLLLYSNHYVIT